MSTIKDHVKFAGRFLRRPGRIGAIAPSSQRLAQRMVEWFDWETIETVLEFGPGTGVFSSHILRAKRAETCFHAIELDSALADTLEVEYPSLRVHREDVRNVRSICDRESISRVDAIVCGLPWAAFPEGDQVAILDAMMQVLPPGGQFATFAYLQGLLLPAGMRFRRKLGEYFSEVRKSPVVWGNMPPAFVYRCRR